MKLRDYAEVHKVESALSHLDDAAHPQTNND